MRAAFVAELDRLAASDSRVVLLTGDLGFMVLEPFMAAHPDRFFNVGVAEANMLGLAAGLAEQGFIPFCYSIATFASLRGYEQLRNGGVLHRSQVRVVGIGGGYGYGSAGVTHHALEDIGVMRLQPGLSVIAPADDAQASAALRATYDLAGPIYYRVGKDRASIPALEGRFRLGALETIGSGADVLLVTTGAITAAAVEAAAILEAGGVSATVAVMASVVPAPVADLEALVRRHRRVVSVEDHYATGGVGTIVAEVIAESGAGCVLRRCAVGTDLGGRSGSEAWLRTEAGLAADQIAAAAREGLRIRAAS